MSGDVDLVLLSGPTCIFHLPGLVRLDDTTAATSQFFYLN